MSLNANSEYHSTIERAETYWDDFVMREKQLSSSLAQ